MAYAFILGLIAGFFPNVEWWEALAVILLALVAKAVYGMVTGKEAISQTESLYSLYLQNLDETGDRGLAPRASYLIQLAFFGGLIGLLGFFLVRLLI